MYRESVRGKALKLDLLLCGSLSRLSDFIEPLLWGEHPFMGGIWGGRFWFENPHRKKVQQYLLSSHTCFWPSRVIFRQSLLRDSPNSKAFTSSFATVAKKKKKTHNNGVLNRVCHYTRRKLGSCHSKHKSVIKSVMNFDECIWYYRGDTVLSVLPNIVDFKQRKTYEKMKIVWSNITIWLEGQTVFFWETYTIPVNF